MKNIEFRGKCIDTGKWVHGSLLQGKHTYIVTKDDFSYAVANHKHISVGITVVDPETVGEFTDIRDKHGKKIFYGDKVKCVFAEYYSNACVTFEEGDVLEGTILFDNGGWAIIDKDSTWVFLFDVEDNFTVEIVGKIHD